MSADRPRATPRSETPARQTRKRAGEGAAFSTGQASTYRSCAEARAAGAAPVRVGDTGYSRRLDRDGDGVGCE
ncbi:excalibur calcium-binding domain-containing protein [Sphingomonas panni]